LVPAAEYPQHRALDGILGEVDIAQEEIRALKKRRQEVCGEPPKLLVLA
jgi:hypothetical protein